MPLPQQVSTVMTSYLSLVDEEAPGLVEGLYLTTPTTATRRIAQVTRHAVTGELR
jgi:hypothetical protein